MFTSHHSGHCPRSWVALLREHTPEAGPVGWDDVIVGHDFGLLEAEAIVAWARERSEQHPAVRALGALQVDLSQGIDALLWDACGEATGRVPRPGSRRWAMAQDRWRVALLRKALREFHDPFALAQAVEAIYECVGCPDDMLGLWRRSQADRHIQPAPDLDRIERFIATRAACLGLAG